MSTAITTTAENAGLPAMLDTKDVAEMFKRCNLAGLCRSETHILSRSAESEPMQKVSEAGAAKGSNGGSGIGLPMTAPSAVLD